MVGPNPPDYELPKNLKYIQSNVKPAQCWFIASHNVEGDFICYIGDDAICDAGSLDSMVGTVKSSKNIMASVVSVDRNPYDLPIYYAGVPRIVKIKYPLPHVCVMYKQAFDDINIDRGFLSLRFTEDMALELISRGGQVVIDKHHTYVEVDIPPQQERLVSSASGICDYGYFLNMWLNPISDDVHEIRSIRAKPIEPFVYNDTVLTVSQGATYPTWP